MSRFFSLFLRIYNRLLLDLDGFNWLRTLAPLRSESRQDIRETILFCDVMAMPATAKVEALMAGLLRLKGYRPVVLLENPSPIIERLFKAAAPDTQFVYLSDIPDSVAAWSREEATRLMADTPDLQDLVTLEVDGYRIGRNVQSLVLRRLRVGRLDSTNPTHRAATLTVLARSLSVKTFIEDMLARIKPGKAVFVERGYTPAGEVFDGCLVHGVDAIQWCGAPQSDSLLYRRYDLSTRNEHPLKLSDGMWSAMQEMPWNEVDGQEVVDFIAKNYSSGVWYNRQQLQDGKAVIGTDAVRQKLGLDPDKKTAVIFAHILYDATFFYGESVFEDYEQWLVETVRCAIANPHLNWVVKVHPVNVWRSKMDGAEMEQLEAITLRKHFGELPEHITLMAADTDINTFSLFEVMDYGLTVRGTIGMELPCFGISVVTAGTGRYSGRGFTIDPVDAHEFRDVLSTLHKVAPLSDDAMRLARLHYYGALKLRPVPMQSFVLDFHAETFGCAALEQNVRLKARAGARLLDTQDLGRFARWVEGGTSVELLSHDIVEKEVAQNGA